MADAIFWFKGDSIEEFLEPGEKYEGQLIRGLGKPSKLSPIEWVALWICAQNRWIQYEDMAKTFGLSESTVRKFLSGCQRPRIYEALVDRIPTFAREFSNPKQYKCARRFSRPTGNQFTRVRQMQENDWTVWGATAWTEDCPTKDVLIAKAEAEICRS